jgi:phosphoribosylaminoimidazole-succinocarboxamide synthase
MRQHTQSLLDEKNNTSEKSGSQEVIYYRQGKSFRPSAKPECMIQKFESGESNEEVNQKMRPVDIIRNRISSYLFEYLDGFHIPTHFLSKPSDTEMLVKKTYLVPFYVKVHNMVDGALLKRFNFKETMPVEFPIFEHYYSNGTKSNAWINEYHIYALSLATPTEYKQINRIAAKVNAVLRGLCDRRGLMVTDLQLEFGRYKGQIILIGELSPVTCHFLEMQSEQKTKRDRFTLESDNPEQSLKELSDRLLVKV